MIFPARRLGQPCAEPTQRRCSRPSRRRPRSGCPPIPPCRCPPVQSLSKWYQFRASREYVVTCSPGEKSKTIRCNQDRCKASDQKKTDLARTLEIFMSLVLRWPQKSAVTKYEATMLTR